MITINNEIDNGEEWFGTYTEVKMYTVVFSSHLFRYMCTFVREIQPYTTNTASVRVNNIECNIMLIFSEYLCPQYIINISYFR